jgi:pyruvate dehydrogenase E2 component (dihydrolipoamide acetyltransferase)
MPCQFESRPPDVAVEQSFRIVAVSANDRAGQQLMLVVRGADPVGGEQPCVRAPVCATRVTRPSTSSIRIFSSPLARRLAREHGIHPGSLAGSGPNGRVVRQDVEAAIASRDSATPSAVSVPVAAPTALEPPHVSSSTRASSGYTVIPHTGMRRAIARRLTESKSTVPHIYIMTECRVDELLELRRRINEAPSVKISVNDFVVKAVASAFQDVPQANVTWSEEGLRRYDGVDIAVVVATTDGLLTPVVRGVNQLSLSGVSESIGELVERARAGRIRQEELEGGSFAVTNLGMYGITEFSAILNPPQSGILAVGAAKPQAVVVDGGLAVATVMRCTLSVDHRAIDGALAAQWLAAFTERMEHPISILV